MSRNISNATTTTIRLIGVIGVALAISGCSDSSSKRPAVADEGSLSSDQRPTDRLLDARQLLRSGDHDGAVKTVQALLLEQPDNRDAILLAATIEAARDRAPLAIELAASIPINDDRLGPRAAELRYQQGIKSGDDAAAETALKDLIGRSSQQPEWRRKLIAILNRQGRRQEACAQADFLCRRGQAEPAELLSLIRRTDAFPSDLPKGQTPNEAFAAGLGLARWSFTKRAYQDALRHLEPELRKPHGPRRAAAIALRGRLLAETQSFDEIHRWHNDCDDSVQAHGDYWAAVGLFLIQSGEHEGAARALMEAIRRNPTDRVCFQRLSQVLGAMDRPADAAQCRLRGIAISKTEGFVKQLLEAPSNELRQAMAQEMLELGRPFEALSWATLALPSTARQARRNIESKRRSLQSDQRIDALMIQNALSGIDPEQFQMDDALNGQLDQQGSSLTVLQQPEPTRVLAIPQLTDVAKQAGAEFQWYNAPKIDVSSLPIYQSLGGGIAVIDYDLDGWPDLYFAQGSGLPPKSKGTRSNQLLRNVEGRFVEATNHSGSLDDGYSSGLAVGDVNQDGFPDLVIGNLGKNRLLINNGDGTFADRTERLGAPDGRFTSSLAIADITGDALPDIFESNYIEMEGAFAPPVMLPNGKPQQPSPLVHYAQSDRWFRSLGTGHFEPRELDESVAPPGSSLGVVIAEFDGTPGNEVFVGNDARPNHYLFHQGDNQFRNLADLQGIANGFSGSANGCMGIATGDFNRDGTLDLQISNYMDEPANLYLQKPGGGFVDSAVKYGIASATTALVGFGTKACDLDRNGWLDLFTTNGHIFDMHETDAPFKMMPQLFMGIGSRYEIIPQQDLSDYFAGEYLGRTMAMLDYDRDGAIDFVVGHLVHPTALLRNETQTPGNWVQLELIGTASERDAIGAVVEVQTSEHHVLKAWVTAGDGYFTSDEPVVDVGLGANVEIKQVIVNWPSGQRQTFDSIKSGHRYLLVENDPQPVLR